MSDKCKHGIRDITTNLPYCRRCDNEAASELAAPAGSETRTQYRVAGYVTLFAGLGAFVLLMEFDWKIAAAWVLASIAKNAYKRLEALSPNAGTERQEERRQ